MLILGHIGVSAFIAGMMYLSGFGAIIGTMLPNIIDKGLFIIGLAPCSRFFAHSIFFFPVAGLVTYGITKNKKFAIAVALGAVLHLVQDLPFFLPLFYPLQQYNFASICGPLEIEFSPYEITTEIIGMGLLIFVYAYSKKFLQFRKAFWNFVKGEK